MERPYSRSMGGSPTAPRWAVGIVTWLVLVLAWAGLGACGRPPTCSSVLAARAAAPGKPTTVVVAARVDGLSDAVKFLAPQGGNIILRMANPGPAATTIGAADLDPAKQTALGRADVEPVVPCLVSAAAAVKDPPVKGDVLAALPAAQATAKELAAGKPARVLVLGGAYSQLSGIDLAAADLSSPGIVDRLAGEVAAAYRIGPTPGVEVLMVTPGEGAANGVAAENIRQLFRQVGAFSRWQVVDALPAEFQGGR